MEHAVYILWDDAHIWGLIAWRAAVVMRLPYRLIKAEEIAQGALSGKPPALLLVPGGTARLKARALGETGREAVRAYVAGGGHYLGFCGGAGLGLTGDTGLGLCPWSRAGYADRFQHLVSGHVRSRLAGHALCPPGTPADGTAAHSASLPVWWPGRFAPRRGDAVEVLATYDAPDADLWVADLPLNALPQDIFGAWQALYGVNMQADFLAGQPCVLHGRYGRGSYTLSYSHLETPGSPQANAWLAHLLRSLAGLSPHTDATPSWDVAAQPVLWPDAPATATLHAARRALTRLMETGLAHNLLFRRTEWLHGWRAGIPGAALNNLHAALCTALSLPPTRTALRWWEEQRSAVERHLPLFREGTEGYLLAERLATTLASHLPDVVDRRGLRAQREALFGHPMEGGGLYQELLDVADELVFLLAREA